MSKVRLLTALCCAVVIALLLIFVPSPTQPEKKDEDAIFPEMPVIRINTADGLSDFATQSTLESKRAEGIEYVDASVSVEGGEKKYKISNAEARVKVRGNYTLEYPKKSIRINFAEKQGMLGLNDNQKFKDWLLLAEWKDLSMCHTATAFYLADALLGADGYYCSDYLFTEVYINDEYWGVYLLAEQQEAKAGRANAPEVQEGYKGTDIGYFFEYDAYYLDERASENGNPTFEIDYGNYANGKPGSTIIEGYKTDGMQGYTVKSDIYSEEQLEFIATYMENVYKILYSAVCEDTYYAFNEDYTELVPVEGKTAQEVIAEVIDIQSMVDTYLLQEIVMNPDLGWSSFYLSVDMSKKGNHLLTFEAPWDFDSCFGIRAGWENPEGRYVKNTWNPNPWLSIMHEDEWFVDMVKERWAQIKAEGVPERAVERVSIYQKLYEGYFAQNYDRWEQRIIEGNHELIERLNNCKSQGEAASYLRIWLKKRFDYIDGKYAITE